MLLTPHKTAHTNADAIHFVRRAGQSNVMMLILTFATGVAIMGGIFFVFGSMRSNVMGDIRIPQSDEVLNYVASSASNLVKINATTSYAIITLPRKIGDSTYTISGNEYGDKIMLISPEISRNISSPAPFSGAFESNYETAMLKYEDGKITIRGVSN